MPEGWRRESPMPKWMAKEKGSRVQELEGVAAYNERTDRVVRGATACLVIQPDGLVTPGTTLTLKLTEKHGTPTWRFMSVVDKSALVAECHAIGYWLRSLCYLHNDFIGLMVAGPREAKWDGATDKAYLITKTVLEAFKNDAPPAKKEDK